jgi:hypothetical protein
VIYFFPWPLDPMGEILDNVTGSFICIAVLKIKAIGSFALNPSAVSD